MDLLDQQAHQREGEAKAAFKGIEENMKILEQQSLYLKDELGRIGSETEKVAEQSYRAEEKLGRQLQAEVEKLANQVYVDGLFAKTQFSEHNKTLSQLIKITADLVESKEADSY